ncbi:LysR family transcriptional regulator [Flavobacterium agrisoli]|uniref:LysR family transcriptional regulator n=1 Tax=Flavobacterium agrisoli TaxID=2793066 RepID=A0A934UJA7_9FLAO|nr:LysR family transcriptional regulator [Flavobacterium agrisoli]MBK0369389.1 LysR family transcriptional regulator [Flavobacterium agrisoli]
MVNLEWYRTFKSVYKNGNFSLAAKELFISQPAVSQQIVMLEAHVGYKLFNRKSKGVEPTEYAKLLNNLIIDALDRLENVEQGFRAKASDANRLISVGVSKHLFSSLGSALLSEFDFIDFSFNDNDALFELVNSKKIDFAIVSKRFDTFDTLIKKVGSTKLVMVASPNLDITMTQKHIQRMDLYTIEAHLNQFKWFSHDARIPHVKLFWLHVFNKKRPSLQPNYIIPNEYEMLCALSQHNGVALTYHCNAKSLIASNKLQLLWNAPSMPAEDIFLLSGKNEALQSAFNLILKRLQNLL